jgi:LacI family transcriptional regulator
MLGLSRSTVSRALNNSSAVNEATRKRIWETAEELGFRPNRAARSLVLNQSRTLGFVYYSKPEYFWQEVEYGIRKAEQSLHDYGVAVDVRDTDISHPEEQIGAVREMVEAGVDGIAISPNMPSDFVSLIDELSLSGVPVVTVSSDVPESQRLCYVGSDYYRAGRIAGDFMGKITGGTGKVAMLTFSDALMTIQQRIIGFREGIGQYQSNDILGPFKLSRTGEEAYDFTTSLLSKEPSLSGIFVSYGILDSVGQAVLDSGKQEQVKVIGYDLSSEIAALMRNDAVDATICQEPFNQGYYPMEILYRYLAEGKKPFRNIVNIKLEIVTKENLAYYETESDYYNFLLNL